MNAIKKWIVRVAWENPTSGYSRIQGALKDLCQCVGRSTVSRVLKVRGMKPARERPSPCRTFLKAHWGGVAAADFFTSEIWTQKGLVTYCTLFVIELNTRRIHIAGAAPYPDGSFMAQAARDLTDTVGGLFIRHRYLLCDRDSKFTAHFPRALQGAGIETLLTPHRAPNCIAFAERFVR